MCDENEKDGENETDKREDERKSIEDFGSVVTKNPRGNIHCLTIIGQVEGHQLLPPPPWQ